MVTVNSISFAAGAAPITLPGADQVRIYGLDGLGNWKTSTFTEVGSGGSTTSTAEARSHNYVNEITSIRDTTGGTAVTTPFVYDKNGNLLNDGVRIYQYDAFNRLILVSKVSGGTVIGSYIYDAFNRRIQKTVSNGGFTGDIPNGSFDYFYDDQQIIEERDDSTEEGWLGVYFWGQYIDELLFFTKVSGGSSTTYRVLSDLLYRSTAIVTTSNVITEAYDTDAYGSTLCYSGPGTDGLWFTDDDVQTNNPINSTIFTGRQYDPESQIYYYRARYYSPQIGRFISRDPLQSAVIRQGPNLYWYVQNNPANKIDPMGLFSCSELQNAMQQAISGGVIDMAEVADLDMGDMAGFQSLVAQSDILGQAGQQLGKSAPVDAFETSFEGIALAINEFAVVGYEALVNGENEALIARSALEAGRQAAYYDWLNQQYKQQNCDQPSKCPQPS